MLSRFTAGDIEMWRRQTIEIGEPDERYGQTPRIRGSLRTAIRSAANHYGSDPVRGSDDRGVNRRARSAVAESTNLGHALFPSPRRHETDHRRKRDQLKTLHVANDRARAEWRRVSRPLQSGGLFQRSLNDCDRRLILSGETRRVLRGQARFAPREDIPRWKCAPPAARDSRAERSARRTDHGAEGPYGARVWRRGGDRPASFPRSDANWPTTALACSMRLASMPPRSRNIAPPFWT
jgi:hypothetical protein